LSHTIPNRCININNVLVPFVHEKRESTLEKEKKDEKGV